MSVVHGGRDFIRSGAQTGFSLFHTKALGSKCSKIIIVADFYGKKFDTS